MNDRRRYTENLKVRKNNFPINKMSNDTYGDGYQNILSNILASGNEVDNNFVIHSMICGGIAPHQISGQLGHGSASSGFINYNLHSDISNNDISVHTC